MPGLWKAAERVDRHGPLPDPDGELRTIAQVDAHMKRMLDGPELVECPGFHMGCHSMIDAGEALCPECREEYREDPEAFK
jgi:hypothetical protein